MSQPLIHLQGSRTSLVLEPATNGAPVILYWGLLLEQHELTNLRQALSRPVPQGGMDTEAPLSLLPQHAEGFFGQSGVNGHRINSQGEDWAAKFKLQSIERHNNQLEIALQDSHAGLAIAVKLSLDPATDVVQLDYTLQNTGNSPFALNSLLATLPLPAEGNELLTFSGRWCQEFQTSRSMFTHGVISRENRKGRTSHDNFPGMICGQSGFSEQAGDVYGFHLGWSGNSQWRAECLTDGRRLVQFGELLHAGEILLQPGEQYSTPSLYATYSACGLNQLSDNFHRFVRARFIPELTNKPRPVHLNTWEALYFDHQPQRLAQLATDAAAIGVERFIVDDGWFIGRNDDTAALGDWYVDQDKYPDGLQPLISHVTALGMEFGLWVEPEMLNKDSELYRSHPDWLLDDPRYQQPSGRNQYLLDLANPDAYEYIFGRLDGLLCEYPEISYLKWDMNRDHVQASHNAQASTHRQTLAVYRLLDQLAERHPSVEIESCASGGGRVDYGVLARPAISRFWASDCNDALERVTIQRGFSYFFPPEVMGAHIGPLKSHTTSRMHSLDFRALTALPGHFGLECDVSQLDQAQRAELASLIQLHKQYRPLLHSGRLERLSHSDTAINAHAVIADDHNQALLWVSQLAMPQFSVTAPLKVTGLSPLKSYLIRPLAGQITVGHTMKQLSQATNGELVLSGRQLALHGFALPVADPETCQLYELTAVDSTEEQA